MNHKKYKALPKPRHFPKTLLCLMLCLSSAWWCWLVVVHHAFSIVQYETKSSSGTITTNRNGEKSGVLTHAALQAEFQKLVATATANSTDSHNVQQPPHTAGAFLHLGKTGGSTLTQYLRNACYHWAPKPCSGNNTKILARQESFLSFLTTYYHIPNFYQLQKAQAKQSQRLLPPLPLHEPEQERGQDYKNEKDNEGAPPIDYQFYVVTVRDPFTRFRSSFAYQHPITVAASLRNDKNNASTTNDTGNIVKRLRRAQRALSCFDSLQSFTDHLGDDFETFDYPWSPYDIPRRRKTKTKKNGKMSKNDESSWCTNLARAMMAGKVRKGVEHWYYNYQYLVTQTALSKALEPNNQQQQHQQHESLAQNEWIRTPVVLLIRMEHLWEDWRSANLWLGQPTPVRTFELGPSLRNSSSSSNSNSLLQGTPPVVVSLALNPKGRERLCRALRTEFAAYRKLLQVAVNLNDTDKQQSWQESQQYCPENE